MTDYADECPGFILKGWHVLAGLVGFFCVIAAVNTVFIVLAVTTFSGEDARRSYMQGLAYNDVLEARRLQSELGWGAAVNINAGQILLAVTDASGAPVRGLDLDARLRHPADTSLDRELAFTEVRPGVYAADAEVPDGRWTLSATHDGAPPFVVEHQIWRQ